ncbi:hypothetical protein [Halocalculus aciditolerans]|uniref:Uncharacterized protein n=1 Tax=Halocalculus aciditolerans TaxID=1383812 RepID=A0A830FFN5_9EURY|nr:hypothetical protein [Halocalculus aciditolerans]GGL70874.1 hypothetical protein GCM10009039_31200 [Halocalculus aciditolerans]
MDSKRSFVHAGKYFVFTTLFGLLGVGLVAAGIGYGAVNATTTTIAGSVAVPIPTTAGLPGLALAVVGVAVWRFGKAWALYHTLTNAHVDALGDAFDTQRVKSEVVSVVDDRLSDMQQDVQSVNREVRDLKKQDDGDGF